MLTGGTDAREYEGVCKDIHHFTPILVDQSEIDKIHGTNESISAENIIICLIFYVDLIKR